MAWEFGGGARNNVGGRKAANWYISVLWTENKEKMGKKTDGQFRGEPDGARVGGTEAPPPL